MDFIKDWGLIAGVAGLGLGVFLILFREVIRKNIFPQLTKQQSFVIIILFMILVSSIAAYCIYGYFNINKKENTVNVGGATEAEKETWKLKKGIFSEFWILVGKISANVNSDSTLVTLKPQFDEFYEGSMKIAEFENHELLRRMMIFKNDYENSIENIEVDNQSAELRLSCKNLIDELNKTISAGDKKF